MGKAGSFHSTGFYRVEIRHPNYYPHFEEITVADGGSALVRLSCIRCWSS